MKNNFSVTLKGITRKSLVPVYVLHGKEAYFSAQLANRILELAIPVSEKSFNEHILHGKDCGIGEVLNFARQFPMMAERQLVFVKNAQDLRDINDKDSLNLLDNYIQRPLSSTVLVLLFTDALDERKAWVKSANKHAFVYKSIPLYDNELPDFVGNYCQAKGASIGLKAAHLLIEHLGNDLPKLTNEIDKVLLNIAIGQPIEVEQIEKYVGISKDFNVFELQKALGKRDFKQSYKIIRYLGENVKRNPIQPVILMLFTFYSKLLLLKYSGNKSETELCKLLEVRPFFLSEYKIAAANHSIGQVAKAIHALKKADLAGKGVLQSAQNEAEILTDMLIEIYA